MARRELTETLRAAVAVLTGRGYGYHGQRRMYGAWYLLISEEVRGTGRRAVCCWNPRAVVALAARVAAEGPLPGEESF